MLRATREHEYEENHMREKGQLFQAPWLTVPEKVRLSQSHQKEV